MGLKSYNTLAELNIAMASVLNPPNVEVKDSDRMQSAMQVICAQNLNIFKSASPEEAVKFIKHAVKIDTTKFTECVPFLEVAMRLSASALELLKGDDSVNSMAIFRKLEEGTGSSGNELYYKTFAKWISNNEISIGSLNLNDEELLKLAPHLTFLDMSDIAYLAPKTDAFIEQLAKSALNLNHLILSSANLANIMITHLAASTTLTTLTLSRCRTFNKPLPSSLTTLTLSLCPDFNLPLPSSLTSLTLSGCRTFNQPLPPSLTTLTLVECPTFNQPLPLILTTLTLALCRVFNQPLPPTLKTLILGYCEAFNNFLPSTLTTLALHSYSPFNQLLPPNLTTLTLKSCSGFNQLLPPNLTTLTLDSCSGFKQLLPPNLTTLTVVDCSDFNKPFPLNLTKLTLRNCPAFDPNLPSIFVILKCNGVAKAQEALEKQKAEVIIQEYIDKSPSKDGFLPDWVAIKSLPESFIRQQQMIWFALSVCYAREALSDQQWEWLTKTNLVSAIRKLQKPELRFPLMEQLTLVAKAKDGPQAYESLVSAAKGKRSILKIGHLLCAALVHAGVDLATIKLLKERLEHPQGVFADKFKYTEVVKMLLQLQEESRLSAAEKQEILRRACTEEMGVESLTEKAKDAALLTNCRGILMMIEMDKVNALTAPQPLLYQIAEACFREVMSIGQVEGGFMDAYARTFLACRNPEALPIYAGKMASLKDDQVMECLGKFVTSVLNSTFAEERYRIQGNPHLTFMSEQFAGWDNLWNLWKTGEKTCSPQQTADFWGDAPEKITMHDWLTATMYAHRQETTKVPYLMNYLEPTLDVEGRKQIVEELNGNICEHADALKKPGLTEKKKIHEELAYLNIQNKFLELVLQTNMSEEDQKYKLKYLLTILNKYMAESTHIIEEVSKKVESLEAAVRVSGSTICVVDSDDPYDLMLCGTEVDGSCQNITGNPDDNKALLAYLMDGKNRILAVKTAEGPSGKILARCIIRLLWDGKKPVLFCERVYPDNSSYEENLIEMARRKGQTLGVPVLKDYSADDADKYLKTLEALGGPAPFEYSDASVEKMNPNGEFTIPDSYYLIDEKEF